MNFDFHTHGKLSKKMAFSLPYFAEMIGEAKKNGLQGLALTEHFNTLRFEDMYDALDRHYTYADGYYDVDGVRVFPGMEVDIAETGHILLIGEREHIREIRALLEPYTMEGGFVPVSRLLDWSEPYGMLRIGAHPFRDSTPLHHISAELLARLDAFDLNAKDLFQQGVEPYSLRLRRFAAEHRKPIVAGSDTHQHLQYGSVWNRLAADCRTVEDLKRCIAEQQYEAVVSDALHTKVKSAKIVKKLLKLQGFEEAACALESVVHLDEE
ncbi:PHP domain-containing protein [Paenibacillus turpanensis]|uniref:PHP domain-containing protein n=1 Tax=Paenibacillus turpanensis TaxID=2689078 RepID=UPI00140C2B4A|nr:PHP domain-containing protein [Paenibacillus turpanensis]